MYVESGLRAYMRGHIDHVASSQSLIDFEKRVFVVRDGLHPCGLLCLLVHDSGVADLEPGGVRFPGLEFPDLIVSALLL